MEACANAWYFYTSLLWTGERDSARVRLIVLEALRSKSEGYIPSATQTRPETNCSTSLSQTHAEGNKGTVLPNEKAKVRLSECVYMHDFVYQQYWSDFNYVN